MKKNIVTSFVLLVLLAACNDDYNDQFDINSGYQDVKNITMTLQTSDYASIAGDKTNQALALAKDPEGKTGLEALENVGKNGYFTADATADEYIPAFLAEKYPNADLKSKFTVTYNQYQAPSAYLKDFTNISSYALELEDYDGVWGDKVKASYLSPATISKIPAILKEKVASAVAGDMVVVDYAYSETEPSIGGGGVPSEPTWTQVATVPVRALGKSWDFVNMGAIDLSAWKGQVVNIAFKYTSTTTGAATWELKNAKVLSVPYLDVYLFAEATDGVKVKGRLDGTLPQDGELNPDKVARTVGKENKSEFGVPSLVEMRPPALCEGCGHRDMYTVLTQVLKEEYPTHKVFSDIGCYTLGANAPFNAINSCVDMGASITMAKGASDGGLHPAVAVIGDSTFTHSGMTGLLDCVNENANVTIVISDNETTAMTGGQDSAGTGRIEAICAGIGVAPEHIRVVVPLKKNYEEMKQIIREEIEYRGVSVIIPRRECIQTLARKKRNK